MSDPGMVGAMFNSALGKEVMEPKKSIGDVIEQLQCAKINCDNVKKIGPGFVDFVKTQIQDAIEMLETME